MTQFEILAGIDWSAQTRKVAVVDADGELLGEREFAHSGDGLAEMADWILGHSPDGKAAVKAGKSVYRTTLAELAGSLAKAERQGQFAEKIRFFARAALLIVDKIGCVPITRSGTSLFFQIVNARNEKRRDDPRLEQKLCRMGRHLLRSHRRRYGRPRPAASPRHRHSDQRRKLPTPGTRRPHSRTCPRQCADHTAEKLGRTKKETRIDD